MKKVGFIGLLASAALSVSLQAYANDSVTFFVQAPSMLRQGGFMTAPTQYTFALRSDDGLLQPVGQTKLQFGPHTNVYTKDQKISSDMPQKQVGNVALIQYGPGGSSFVRCTARWEHTFWMKGDKHKHDRFTLYITSQYQLGACFANFPASKSGKSAWIELSPPPM